MKRFTLIELLVVIAIIGILVSLLVPTLGKARKQANSAACKSKIKQNFNMIQMMVDDHEGYFNNRYISEHYPESNKTWSERILSDYWSDGNKLNVVCPLQVERAKIRANENRISYGAPNTSQLGDTANPEEIHLLNGNEKTGLTGMWKNGADLTKRWLLTDSYFMNNWNAPTSLISNLNEYKVHLIHSGKANIVFVDGHSEAMNSNQVLYELGFNKTLSEDYQIIER